MMYPATKKRPSRVIDALRHVIPGKWKYDYDLLSWVHESGFEVYRASRLVGMNDMTFGTQTVYVRSDTGEEIDLSEFYWPFKVETHDL